MRSLARSFTCGARFEATVARSKRPRPGLPFSAVSTHRPSPCEGDSYSEVTLKACDGHLDNGVSRYSAVIAAQKSTRNRYSAPF